MLVLSRRVREEIRIGDDIKIVVVEIAGDRALIGIAAPDETKIVSGELIQRNDPAKPAGQV